VIAVRHDRREHPLDTRILERRAALDAAQLPVHTEHRRLAHAEVQIGRALLDQHAQQRLHLRVERGVSHDSGAR
jgi:hypothetical protein